MDQPAGWLGAAAAATVCERARVILGGRPERTLVPADLLDLPRQPVDRFPADPYGNLDARDLSLAAARSRAAAYLDGDVVYRGSKFLVRLELHRADGAELTHAQGSAAALYAAVRAAMDSLVCPTLIPEASALDPHIAAWSGTHEVAAALGLLDLTFAFVHNARRLSAECDRFQTDDECARVIPAERSGGQVGCPDRIGSERKVQVAAIQLWNRPGAQLLCPGWGVKSWVGRLFPSGTRPTEFPERYAT